MDELHRQLIRIGLDALAEDYGYALAGGYAVQVHRDAIDVAGLLKAGYTREQLMDLAAQNDAGFDRRMFADSLARIQRYTDKQFAAYDLNTEEAAAIRAIFADWQQQIL